MGKILKYKGAHYDLDSMPETEKELLKEEIAKQFPEIIKPVEPIKKAYKKQDED